MKTMHKKIMPSLLVLFSLCSCAADMGDAFKTNEDYGNGYNINLYNADRKLVYEEDEEPKITDFYNDDTIENFDCPIDYNQYRYLVIDTTADRKIDEMYIYVNSETAGTLTYKLFVTDKLPSKFSNLDNALASFTEFLGKSEEEQEAGFTFDYGDEPVENAYITGTKTLSADTWSDLCFTEFYQGENKVEYIDVAESQYILIQFYNNVDTEIRFKKGMTLSDAKQAIADRRANRMSIKITDIMIHAC